jgi:hypothetical protein
MKVRFLLLAPLEKLVLSVALWWKFCVKKIFLFALLCDVSMSVRKP